MTLTFNTLLNTAGIDPEQVRLLRHTPKSYKLWYSNRPAFESYHSHQSKTQRSILSSASTWAAFVVAPSRDVLFAGLYAARFVGPTEEAVVDELTGETIGAGVDDRYLVQSDARLSDYAGRVVIDWGAGALAWIQKAANQAKPILEIRATFEEPSFPGFRDFIEPLSSIETLPITWTTTLRAVRGVYLLTCPRTKELYVGSASGEDGFFGRWLQYVRDGHGGNVQLRSRDPSDYQVSILDVAASADTRAEIEALEAHWKRKLQSRQMGLNSN